MLLVETKQRHAFTEEYYIFQDEIEALVTEAMQFISRLKFTLAEELSQEKLTTLRQCIDKIHINKPGNEIKIQIGEVPVGNLQIVKLKADIRPCVADQDTYKNRRNGDLNKTSTSSEQEHNTSLHKKCAICVPKDLRLNESDLPAELLELISVWPTLPTHVKRSIRRLIGK